MKTLCLDDVGNTIPLHFQFSFRPFVRYLEKKKAQAPSTRSSFLYTYLIDQFQPYLSLNQPVSEFAETSIGEELFQLVHEFIEPLVSQANGVPCSIGLPGPLRMFYYSNAFAELTGHHDEASPLILSEDEFDNRMRSFYQLVLERCYHVQNIQTINPTVTFQRVLDGITHYYRVVLNLTFIEPAFPGELPPLQSDWVNFAKGNLLSLTAMPVPLPLDKFVLEGFITTSGEETTTETTLHRLREIFVHLQSDSESLVYERFVQELKNLCGKPGIEIGMMPLLTVNGANVIYPEYSNRSIFLRRQHQVIQPLNDPIIEQLINRVSQHPYPILVPVLEESDAPEGRMIHDMGVRSLLVYPIVAANNVIGTLEMISQEPGTLDEGILLKIERVIPLVRELLLFQQRQFNERIEQVVQQKFTPLQPGVAWKFREAAWTYLLQGDEPLPETAATQVRFLHVYPLYGAIDVRNSSIERNRAVRHDLQEQLQHIGQVIGSPAPGLPASLLSQSRFWQTQLAGGLSSEAEIDLSVFLTQTVNPYFRRLSEQGTPAPLQTYFDYTDGATGLFRKNLRGYERSLERINTTLSTYLEQEITTLQARYPIYFEKYRTDGVEYTLYAGQSIGPKMTLHPDYLAQLQLWQLSSMIDMARLTHRLRMELPLPLQTTQLILSHAQAVDISFRRDERRFDVDGSYSIHYEVIKKRIDKALIKGSQERLTQPDTLALIFTHSPELYQFSAFISRLQAEHKLQSDIEYLDLEPLQGVANLKAMRLWIDYTE